MYLGCIYVVKEPLVHSMFILFLCALPPLKESTELKTKDIIFFLEKKGRKNRKLQLPLFCAISSKPPHFITASVLISLYFRLLLKHQNYLLHYDVIKKVNLLLVKSGTKVTILKPIQP